MIAVFAIVGRHRGARFRAAFDEVLAAIEIEHRYTALGEGEVIRTVIIAGFGIGIGRRHAVVVHQRLVEEQVELRLARPDHGHILGRTGHQEGVHIDAAYRPVERENRVRGVIIRTQQARFLCGYGEKDEAAFGRPRLGMGFGQRDQRCGPGRIVDRAVADIVAIGSGRAASEMVPMRRMHDVFVRALASRQDADHVLRSEGADIVREAGRRGEAQRDGCEVLFTRGGHQLVEILACGRQDFARLFLLYPAIDLRHRRRIVAARGIGLRAGPATFDDVPAITGRFGIVDDDGARRALAGGFLILIGPAAVIGHRLAVEGTFERLRPVIGIVDQDDRGLARHVHAVIVVPALLGRVDAVADEDQFAVLESGLGILAIGHTDPVGAVGELHVAILATGDGQRGIIPAGNLDQGHVLDPAAVVAGCKAGLLEFLDQIGDGLFLARGAGRTALELIG